MFYTLIGNLYWPSLFLIETIVVDFLFNMSKIASILTPKYCILNVYYSLVIRRVLIKFYSNLDSNINIILFLIEIVVVDPFPKLLKIVPFRQ